MTHVLTGWIVVTLLFGAIGIAAVWSRTSSIVRTLGVVAFLVGSPIVALAAASGLGWAVPIIPYVTAPAGDFQVLGVKIVQDVAIYVLVDTGQEEPIYLRMDFDQETADKIQAALDNPNSGGLAITIPYEFSWDMNEPPMVYELPQPPMLPPKDLPQADVPRFDA